MAKRSSLFAKIKDAVTGDNEKEPQTQTDDEHGTSEMLDRYWNTAYGARSELDWKWFQYDLWYNGNHYAKWDKNTQQIISVNPRIDGRPKVTINKTYSTLRGIRSYVLKNDPKAEVTPYNMTDQETDQALYLNRYLDYLHNHLHLRASIRASMLHALKYSVGWWQILWDDEAEDGKGGIVVNVVDPYDLYIDPIARLPKEARFMILAVRRNIDDLREDPKYKDADWDSIVGTDMMAASTLKSRMLMYERGQYTFNDGEKEHGSVILKEFWYTDTYDSEEDEEDPEHEGKTIKVKKRKNRIMISAKVGEQIVRKPEDSGLDRLPFFRLASDIEPLMMYGQGWCKNLVPLNRMLETNESSIMEYNVVVNKGRYSIDKNAGVKTVVNQHGTFVEHKMGHEVVPLEVPQLSSVIENQVMRINQYIEDIGCQHDASKGMPSPNATSGVAIEALQEGDSNNLSELIENTEEFLQDSYEYMLYLLSQKLVFARNVITSTNTGEKMFFKVIGEDAEDDLKMQGQSQNQAPTPSDNEGNTNEMGQEPKKPGMIIIPKKCAVNVTIDSELAYTADGRRQAMKDLASFPQMQSLPPDVILKAYNVGPIADIVKQIRLEQQRQAQAQAQQQQIEVQQQTQQKLALQQHQQQAQAQAQNQQAQFQQQQDQHHAQHEAQIAERELAVKQSQEPKDIGAIQATAFIRQLIRAIDSGHTLPQLPRDITPAFIQYIAHFAQSAEGQANPEIAQVLEMIKDRATLQMGGGVQRAQASA